MNARSDRDGAVSRLTISANATILEALRILDEGGASIAFVTDSDGRVLGSLTDGDVRRAILSGASLESRCLSSAMCRDFAFVSPQAGRAEVLDLMRARDIEQIPVLDPAGRLRGLHKIHQLIAATERQNWAVIMAGGRGTRLQPVTQTLPKPMIPVAGRPILERLVLHLMSHGLRRLFLSVNHLAHVIEDHFGDGSRFGCQIEYLRETKPLGTGGSLALLPTMPSEPVVVINGDLVTQCDIGGLLDFHVSGDFVATVGLRPFSMKIPFGVADVQDNRLVALREKPTERMLINAGIYVLSPAAIRMVPNHDEFPITNLFEQCRTRKLPVGAYLVEEDWLDVGQHSELRIARGEA